MSTYTLYLWKAPVVDDPDEAERLMKAYNEREDDSAFQPSAAVATVSDELLRRFPDRFPDAKDGPWEAAPYPTDRLLAVTVWNGADNADAVLDAIFALAREHELVLYDPQGPDVTLPGDPLPGPTPPLSLFDRFKMVLMGLAVGLAGAGVFWLGWRIEVPVLEWVLMFVGGFGFSLGVFLIGIFVSAPASEDGPPDQRSTR
jgi:hypothetical protein